MKYQLLTICFVNVATQSVLNILLNVVNYRYGSLSYIIGYFVFEFFVIVIEAVIFYFTLHKFNKEKRRGFAVFYACPL